MKNINDISEKVKKRKDQLEPLFTKDEENYDLWAGKEQIFDDHPMSVNITGTEMTALARRVQASLTRSRLDVRVLPPNPLPNPEAEKTANREEDMYYYGFEMADERLSNVGEASLSASAAWQAVVLGRIAVRVCVYKDKKTEKLIWDYLPLNPRFLTFSFDRDGLAWACYETFRSPDSIKSEYGKEVIEDTQGKGVSVSDYWDRDHNVRYLTKDKEPLKTWKHPFKEVPIILQPIHLGPKAITSEGINVTAWGQSIYDHVNIPFRNLNKMRSIAATHAHILAKNPTEIIYEDGTVPNIEEEHFEFHAGSKIKHPKSVVFQPMKQNDIPASLMAMMGDISTGIERATFTDLNPDKPAHSGTALRILGQDRRDAETPRVEGLNTMYTRICRMSKEQIRSLELTIPVKTVVDDRYEVYDMKPALLDNDFYVRAELVRQDVYDEVEALSRAQMLLQLRLKSRKKIMEEVMLEQDVPTQIIEMDIEEIEAAIPEMKLLRLIKVLRDDKQMPEEAKMVEEQLSLLILQKQQALQGGMPGATPTGGTPSPSSMPPTGRQGVVPGVP